MIQTHKFKINGMHCTSCAMNIDGELEDADGVVEAKTSYARQETEVKYDDEKIVLERIKELIQKTGYSVDN
jgi:copper chaperone CopZ